MTTPTLFQLTEEDIERSSSLEPADVGRWCFELNGCIQGFFETREEGDLRVEEALSRSQKKALKAWR